ncbi:MAG: hypothetical protein IKZ95_05000 [Lachnospiraceae bacterium]|nr:hypothetical protein [Lachnospiraceae bacterium]
MRITVVVWVLFAAGIFFFVYELIRKEIRKEDILNWTNLFLLIGLVVLFIYLLGRRFIFIDDYTHWGVIARHIVENQALPTAADPLITFPSYVPGSALWVAYVATMTGGTTEGFYLIAQAFLILVFFAPLTGCTFREKKNRVGMSVCMLIVTMVLCAVTMSFSATIISLCVDGLLAACALSGIFFLILSDCSLRMKAWFLIPLMVTVLSIKSAGILYAASEFAVLIYLFARDKKRVTAGFFAAPVISILAELFWQWHVKAVFPDAGSTMHALSIARWKEIYASRSPEVVRIILKEFFRKITLWYLVLFVVAIVVFYLFIYICGRKSNHKVARQGLWMMLLCLGNYVVYLAGMLFVYLFSMEAGNADRIAAFDRYMWVELIYMGGLCVCFVFRLFSKYEDGFTEDHPVRAKVNTRFRQFAIRRANPIRMIPLAVAAIAGVAFLLVFWKFGPKYDSMDYPTSTIGQINALSPSDYTGDVLIYAPSQMEDPYDESLLLYFGRYRFRSTDVDVALFERDDVESKLSRHTHFFIAEPDDQLAAYLHGKGWTGDIVPGMYDVEKKALAE